MQLKLTSVATEAIWCEGKLLVVFSNGDYKQYTCYSKQDDCRRVINMRDDQIIEACRSINTMHRLDCNARLHANKVATLGWDYAQRGYR